MKRVRFSSIIWGYLVLLLILTCWASLAFGQFGFLDPRLFLQLLTSPDPDAELWSTVLWNIRLPRLLLGILAGVSLGLAGLLVQALFQNPLAEPYLLGISSGAALGAVLAGSLGLGIYLSATWILPASAFLGSLAAIFIILNFAALVRPISPDRLLLAGIAISGLFQAMATLILLRGSPHELREILFWLLGRVGNQNLSATLPLGLVTLIGTCICFAFLRPLNLLSTGEFSARALGLSVGKLRWGVAVLAALFAAATTATCGIIAFVGLLVPHLGRLLVGPEHRRLFPACLLLGPILLLLSDLAARLLLPGREIPISIITGALGCLVFLALLLFKQPGNPSLNP